MKKKWIFASLILIVILGLCVAMGSIGYSTFIWLKDNSSSAIDLRLPQVSAEKDESKTYEISTPAVLDVNSPFGKIDVLKGDDDQIVIKSHIVAYDLTQTGAEQCLEDTKVVVTREENHLIVRVEQNRLEGIGVRTGSAKVDFTIYIPAKTEVIANSDSGDVSLEGADAAADLHSDFGSVSVKDLTGALVASSNSGSVTAVNVKTTGKVELNTDFGQLSLSDSIAGDVDVKTNSGDVDLRNVDSSGSVTLGNDFGNISFESGKARELTASSNSGTVELIDLTVKNSVTATSDMGSVTMEGVDAKSYDADAQNGSITLTGVTGSVKAYSDFGIVEVRDGNDVILDLHSSNGDVFFAGSLANASHVVDTDFGNVTLQLASDTSVDVELQTDFGEITSDFEMSISGTLSEKHIVGKIGAGGLMLAVTTKNGNITLQKIN